MPLPAGKAGAGVSRLFPVLRGFLARPGAESRRLSARGGDVLKAAPSRRRVPTQSRCKPAFPGVSRLFLAKEAGFRPGKEPAFGQRSRLLPCQSRLLAKAGSSFGQKKSRLFRPKPALLLAEGSRLSAKSDLFSIIRPVGPLALYLIRPVGPLALYLNRPVGPLALLIE